MDSAAAGLIGVVVGAAVTVGVELLRQRAASSQKREDRAYELAAFRRDQAIALQEALIDCLRETAHALETRLLSQPSHVPFTDPQTWLSGPALDPFRDARVAVLKYMERIPDAGVRDAVRDFTAKASLIVQATDRQQAVTLFNQFTLSTVDEVNRCVGDVIRRSLDQLAEAGS